MKDYRAYILNALLDKYEQSKASRSGVGPETQENSPEAGFSLDKENNLHPGGSNYRRVFLRYSKHDFSDYWVDTSSDFRLEIDRVSRELAEKGLIRIHWPRHAKGEYIEKVSLVADKVEEAYKLARRVPRQAKESDILATVNKWRSRWFSQSFSWTLDFLAAVETAIVSHARLPGGLSLDENQALEEICLCLEGAFRLETEMPKRLFSVEVLGDSKRFEKLEKSLLRVMKEFYPAAEELKTPEDLLAELGIVQNPQHIFLSGPLVLKYKGTLIDIGQFEPDVGLPAPMIYDSRVENLKAEKIITVENLTSFYQLAKIRPAKTLLIYLGGYHNRVRRSLLIKLGEAAANKPGMEFLHWGDLDLGGFRIFNHLREKTGLPLRPYRMDLQTYLDHLDYGVSFDQGYAKKLEALLERPEYRVFHQVIKEMLKQGKRIEQEAVRIIF